MLSSFSDKFIISFPSIFTLPLVGFSSKFTRRNKVDLPAPEYPTIPKISPFSTFKETFLKA